MRPRKRFAQHWLRSEAALQAIVTAADLTPQDRVLEIGPGQGALTERLLSQAGAVLAVELDRDLGPNLVRRFGDRDNFLLLQGDILDLNLGATLRDFPRFQQPNKVVANIPYNITGPLLQWLLGTIGHPVQPAYDCLVLLVQQEVAERLCAAPSSKAFGALSVRVQYLATGELICSVPPRAFSPPPRVNSAVVRLRPRTLAAPAREPHHLERLLKLGFSSRRKMLRNNLQAMLSSEVLQAHLEALGLNPQARAENLGLSDWIALSDRLVADHAPAGDRPPSPPGEGSFTTPLPE